MITKPTVLVLGAGASKPYGYPTGKELYYHALYLLGPDQGELATFLWGSGNAHQFDPFREALYGCGLESIDTFLESRKQFVLVGKLVMAYILCLREEPAILHQRTDEPGRWYKYLFGIMKTNVDHLEDFSQNRLAVITFNYDRSLEQFLFTSLKHSFGESDAKCAAELAKIPIVHVHGRLGWLPWQQGRPVRGYEKPERSAGVIEAARSIKIVHEQSDVDSSTEFIQAHDLLAKASTICFLGFGYHETNVKRLQLERLDKNCWVGGTCFQQTEHERNTTVNLVEQMSAGIPQHRIFIGPRNQDVLTYLRDHPVLS